MRKRIIPREKKQQKVAQIIFDLCRVYFLFSHFRREIKFLERTFFFFEFIIDKITRRKSFIFEASQQFQEAIKRKKKEKKIVKQTPPTYLILSLN